MTEEEAKTKWCCMVRLSNSDGQIYNRVEDNDPKWSAYPQTRCIASGCMFGLDRDGNWQGFCGLNAGGFWVSKP